MKRAALWWAGAMVIAEVAKLICVKQDQKKKGNLISYDVQCRCQKEDGGHH